MWLDLKSTSKMSRFLFTVIGYLNSEAQLAMKTNFQKFSETRFNYCSHERLCWL